MRMRTKKWAKPELAVCPYYIKNASDYRGKWENAFKQRHPIYLELGCGKGSFLSEIASKNPEINFIAIDLSSDMLGLTKRNVEAAFSECGHEIDNVLLTWQNIERIDDMLSPEDKISRIYINFCNPWFKPAQYKKRLTHPKQLAKYREFLISGGEIRFKTDDDELFIHSVKYFEETGFKIIFKTLDLHSCGFDDDYPTEHEKMYTQKGIKTKYLIAVSE